MNVKQLFEDLGALMYDQPDAAEMPVKVEMLIDAGLAWDDLVHIRQGTDFVSGVRNRTLILSADGTSKS